MLLYITTLAPADITRNNLFILRLLFPAALYILEKIIHEYKLQNILRYINSFWTSKIYFKAKKVTSKGKSFKNQKIFRETYIGITLSIFSAYIHHRAILGGSKKITGR